MNKPVKTAITPTRRENYAEWYQQVIRAADMAELSGVRGCMVIKPWGYGIWEQMQRGLDTRFKATGHDNAYFPLFIPLSYLQKEADHVAGFAKETAVVTHHRLVTNAEGKLVPDPASALEEPLIVRPTSETVIGEAFANWVQSYRDLPILINQWANVVRWEMRPRIFLRTVEFLWQEGHTAHETQAQAMEETKLIHQLYQDFAEQECALPVIPGEKIAAERFPGAVNTYCIEAMMQDGRALQAGTSHYLGQNFAKAANIRFQSRNGDLQLVHTTSWGVSTRLIGAVIMTHADDDGLRLPPRIATQQIMIVPIVREDGGKEQVLAYCEMARAQLAAQSFADFPVRVRVDARDLPSAEKRWDAIKKGVPLIVEIGLKDLEKNQVCVQRRDQLSAGKQFVERDEFVASVADRLQAVQDNLYAEAKQLRDSRMVTHIKTQAELIEYFEKMADNGFAAGLGFVRAGWCGDEASLQVLERLGVTVRCIPDQQTAGPKTCVLTGKPAEVEVIFARAY